MPSIGKKNLRFRMRLIGNRSGKTMGIFGNLTHSQELKAAAPPYFAHPSAQGQRLRSRPPTLWARLLCIALVMLAAIPVGQVNAASRTVRVGVYQNEPKIFMNASGNAAGFFVDLLQEIAARESWTLVYVPCEWEACLAALSAGQIDLMPDVAYSPERDEKYDFHRIPAAESWFRVYANPGSQINRMDQLDGKSLSILSGSIQQTALEQTMQAYGFKVAILPAPSPEEAFKLVKNGSASATVANQFFGDYTYQKYGLVRTSIIFAPTMLYYAAAQGRNPDLLDAIDKYLGVWRDDPNSIYATIMNRWLNPTAIDRGLESVARVVVIIFLLLFLAVAWILLLRKQVRDRTRHLLAVNQTLQESEERYRLISTVTSDYMFSSKVDAHGNLTFDWVAGAFEAIAGYTFEEYLAHGGWRASLHPDDLAADDQDLEKLRANQPVIREIRTITRAGKTVWVRVYAHPVWNSQQNALVGINGAVQDITEHKRAEEIIESSEKRLSSIFDTVSDVIFLLSVEPDDCFRFVSINPAFLAVTGLRREQVVGKRVQEVLPESAQALAIHNYKQALRENKTVKWEEVSAYPNGTHYGEVAVTPFLNNTGSCTNLVGSVHDITQNRLAEIEIRKLNEDLEQRVAERTTELEGAKVRAESADRLKSAFLATMSHELRTPLNSIIGFTGMLLMRLVGPLEPEQEKQLNMVQDSARHLLELINDVLDISKIEAGQFELAHESFDMQAALKKSIEKFIPLAEKKGVALTTAISPQVGQMLGDRRRVEQIMLNLLSNALKFTERGGIHLACFVEDGKVITCISDTGIGIKPEQIDSLFQPFKQLDTGITRQHEGTGLGLSICKRLVEAMQGKIWVESAWGQGSSFSFSLPMQRMNI
jgi:PAS domain S-box-containing protein